MWAGGEGSECSEVEELWQVEAGLVVGLVADDDGSIPEDKGDEGKAESSVRPQEGEEGGEVREEGGERNGEEFGG